MAFCHHNLHAVRTHSHIAIFEFSCTSDPAYKGMVVQSADQQAFSHVNEHKRGRGRVIDLHKRVVEEK